MDVPSPTAKLAAAVLEGCTNVLHAAYTNRNTGSDHGLQFLLDDVRKLAAVVSTTAPFWGLNPAVRISDHFINVLGAMRQIFIDSAATLGRLEVMLVCQREEAMPLGWKPFDFKLLRWKIQIFAEATSFAKRRNNDVLLNMEKLRTDAGWFQVQADHVDDRGETGERLLVEIVDTDDHLRHIEALVVAAKEYTETLARAELADRQNNTMAKPAMRVAPIEGVPVLGGPPESDDEETESVAAEESLQDADAFDDAAADDSLAEAAAQDGPTESVATEKATSNGVRAFDEAPEESVAEEADKALLEAATSDGPSDNASLGNAAMESDPAKTVGAEVVATQNGPSSNGHSKEASVGNDTTNSELAQSVGAANVATPDVPSSSQLSEDASLKEEAIENEPAESVVVKESFTPNVSPPSSPSLKASVVIALAENASYTDALAGVVFTPEALTAATFGQDITSQALAAESSVTSNSSPADEATQAAIAVRPPLPAFRDAKSFKTEDERVAYICALVKEGECTRPDESLDTLIRSFSLSVPAKLIVAGTLYLAGKPESTIKLLQLPLYEYPTDLVVRSSVQHLLAKAYFATSNFGRAIDNCKISQAARKKGLGHHHPLFLESTELLVHLFRATGRAGEAEDLRRLHFSPEQMEFLGEIDDLELAFVTSKETALACMVNLYATFKVDDPMPTMSPLEGLGNFRTWKFEAVVLGFDMPVSLLTILAELGDYNKLALLAIRGNIHLNLSSNRTRPILDTLLWKAAMADNAIRVQMLLDIGADIETDHDCLEDWNTVGAEFNSMTPLHIAARSGYIDVVRILLKAGANKEARDSDNNTPLMLADKNHYADVVELLLEHGATID